MRVLVLGSGGREHALCWRLSQCPSVTQMFCGPGNPGTAQVATNVSLPIEDAAEIAKLCKDEGIDLVVVGPERSLMVGVADVLQAAGIAVYGPSRTCAEIEGSKAFAKQWMHEEGVPTARYGAFTSSESAIAYIQDEYAAGRKVVVKASGDALGKGVVVAQSEQEAKTAVRMMLEEAQFGEAGETIVIEEQLTGEEASVFAICSGENYCVLPTAKDYKAAYDGGTGPNTGGMGSISPGPKWADGLAEQFISPILRRFSREGTPYVGTLFVGLMNTPDGPKALEYNARFGDPETQSIMPRIEGDLAAALFAAATMKPIPKLETSPLATTTVVIAADGYPGGYSKGIPLPLAPEAQGITVFYGGTRLENGNLVSAGGRILGVTATADSPGRARQAAYGAADAYTVQGLRYRKDIGL